MISRGQLDHDTFEPSRFEDEEPKKRKIDDEITFFEAALNGIKYPLDDPVVVSLNIANYDVHWVLVNNGSFVDVLFYNAFIRIDLNSELLMKRNTSLIVFSDSTVSLKGTIPPIMIAG